MKLRTYLGIKGLSQRAFAKRLDVKPITVWRWCHGHRLPDRASMQRIFEATGGQVSANDFYDLQPRKAA